MLYACGATCGPSCDVDNFPFGKDEACTRCTLTSNAAACVEDRARCNGTTDCAAVAACYATCR